jgi:Domain of unknown function (DUF1816)
MEDTVLKLVNAAGLAWWVEVITESPRCTYYFGPFALAASAHQAKAGYVEDLEHEGATGIQVSVRRCRPSALTISEELDEGETTNGHQANSVSLQPPSPELGSSDPGIVPG